MLPRIRSFGIILALALATSGHAAERIVEIYNYYFTPTNLVIAPGDTVTWLNMATTPHDTTHADFANAVWAAPAFGKGETFSFTFNQIGQYPYVCATHFFDHPEQTGLVVVAQMNLPPSVRIASPANDATFTDPASFTIVADASDADGNVASVQFFVNGASAGVSQGPTFSGEVSGLTAGNYALSAVATDDRGATNLSATVNVSVQSVIKFPLSLAVLPSNGGTVTATPPASVDGYSAGTVVMLTASAAEGFSFSGWSGGATGTQNPLSVTMDAAKSITANFSPVVLPTLTLTLATNPPNGGTIQVMPAPNAAGGRYVQGTDVTLTAVPAFNFAFMNWSGDISSPSHSIKVTLDTDKTLTANFFESLTPAHVLTLVTNPPAAGRIQASPTPNAPNGQYYEGTVVTLTASALGLNAFTNWSGATNSTAATITIVVDADKMLTANFVAVIAPTFTLDLTVTPATAGSVAVTPASSNGNYSAGTLLALSAQPNVGFRFLRWSGAVNSTNNPIPLVMDGHKSVTANFESIPPLDFAGAGGVYAGLLIDEQDTNNNYTASGFFNVRLSKSGAYRGLATIGGMREFIAGQFDRFGYAPLVVRRASLSGSLQLEPMEGRMAGSLTDYQNPLPNGRRSPALLLHRAAATTNAAALAGNYSIMFEVHEPVPESGAASMQVLPDNRVRLRGTLGDGSAFRERTFLSADRRIPLFVPLYRHRGAILGWLDVMEDGTVQGTVRWFRPPDSRSLPYPDGFALTLAVTGSRAE
jgi:uncharacterized repeat protein (TIGR02543 family)